MRFLLSVLICSVLLVSCGKTPLEQGESAVLSPFLADATDAAKSEFETIFAEFENIQTEVVTTSVRTSDENHFVIGFTYTSDSGDGFYAFEYRADDSGNPELIAHGEDITAADLIKPAT